MAWLTPATALPVLLFGVGGLVWVFGFLQSFGEFATFADRRLVTTTMNVGLVLVLTGLFVVGLKALRRLEKAAKPST